MLMIKYKTLNKNNLTDHMIFNLHCCAGHRTNSEEQNEGNGQTGSSGTEEK